MMADKLFQTIADMHGALPWGDVLDAGTGKSSLNWVHGLTTNSWTAVTGANGMARELHQRMGTRMRPQDRLIIGNWGDDRLLAGESFDTVLADYLIGALEGFLPYRQDDIFERLRPLVRRRLYVVGTEPYVGGVHTTDAGRLVSEIGRVRDACLLLADERPYREFPLSWALRRLQASAFRVVAHQQFPIRYGQPFVDSQIHMSLVRLNRLADQPLAAALNAHIHHLHRRASAFVARHGALAHGADYVICAEPG